MARLKTYFNVFVWQAGVGYLALWAITYWALDQGAVVFGQSGVCHPDAAKVLFYWVCDAASPYAFLAALANFALTVTVWSPVYIAAATVEPDAIAIALPIVLAHVVGLPASIFVLVRLMAAAFDRVRLHARSCAPCGRRRGQRRSPPPIVRNPDAARPSARSGSAGRWIAVLASVGAAQLRVHAVDVDLEVAHAARVIEGHEHRLAVARGRVHFLIERLQRSIERRRPVAVKARVAACVDDGRCK